MIRKQTWILLAVFIALLLAAWLFSTNKEKLTPAPTATSMLQTTDKLFSFEETALASVRVTDTQGRGVTLTRGDAGWSVTDPPAEITDVTTAQSAITQMLTTNLLSSLEETAGLSQFGLDLPAYTIYGLEVLIKMIDNPPVWTPTPPSTASADPTADAGATATATPQP